MTRGTTAALFAAMALLPLAGRDATAERGETTGSRGGRSTLSVSISGPRTVQPGYTCQWTAVVSGGTPPYEYFWLGLNDWGYDATFSGTTSGSGLHPLYLEVIDGNGEEAFTGKSISGTGYGCGY